MAIQYFLQFYTPSLSCDEDVGVSIFVEHELDVGVDGEVLFLMSFRYGGGHQIPRTVHRIVSEVIKTDNIMQMTLLLKRTQI